MKDRSGFFKVAVRRTAIFLFVLLLLGANLAHAQRIFLLAAGDTTDPKLSKSIGVDLSDIWTAFYGNVPEWQFVSYSEYPTMSESGAPLTQWIGPPVEKSRDMMGAIRQALARCPSGPNDTIVFYWSGHGAYDERGHYIVSPNRKPIYRAEIVEAIRRKTPRLAVVLTDSCSNWYESRFIGGEPAQPQIISPERISPLFDSLFVQCRGVVDINAASEEEYAIGVAQYGGLFTSALCFTPAHSHEPADFGTTERGVSIQLIDDGTPQGEPVTLPDGFFWKYWDMRKSWNDLITYANRTMRTTWKNETRQTVRSWSLPAAINVPIMPPPIVVNPPVQPPANLPTGPIFLEPGDVILSIGGQPIRGYQDCIQLVGRSPLVMRYVVRNGRDGRMFELQTTLRIRSPRFGANLRDAPGGGAAVTSVTAGSPATRNRVLREIKAGPVDPPHPPPVVQRYIQLEPGDIITRVNGQPVRNTTEYWNAVKASPRTMVFVVENRRTQTSERYSTELRNTRTSRFGVAAVNHQGRGVRVTRVSAGSPGTKCLRTSW